MKKILRSNHGGVAVFLCIAFSVMMLLLACLFAATVSVSGKSCADAAWRGAGRSVLSEYDNQLMDRYGLLAFKGDEKQVARDLCFYANAGLKKNNYLYLPFVPAGSPVRFFDFETKSKDVDVNLKEFSLLDLDSFESQVKEAALSEFVKKHVDKPDFISAAGDVSNNQDKSEDARSENADIHADGADTDADSEDTQHKDRTLRNSAIIESLPSKSMTKQLLDIDISKLPTPAELVDKTSANILVNEYILCVFRNAYDGSDSDKTFYAAEVEYILSGKKSESVNRNFTKAKLVLIRFGLNNLAIITDKEKMEEISKLAEPFAAAAGIGEAVAAVLITEAWVTAETNNDISLLKEGKNVALYKSKDTWALNNIEEIWNGTFGGETVYPSSKRGFSYTDYLGLMLFFLDRQSKLLRTMDLIQINMKGTYNESFLIREHYTGYRFSVKAKGDVFEYTEQY